MPQFRKRPVVVEAVKWTGNNRTELIEFLGGEKEHIIPLDGYGDSVHSYATIKTLEGRMHARCGDWVVKGIKGEFYPVKPDIFVATYEPVLDERPDAGEGGGDG